ncbi:hypothetical protein E4T38_01534 [Aureobasidium subglaciale]|nr:hypothetical protein E4T38_01534 [Aureobasidium subglaciale]KAI5219088.1 hypothetical protein E4T40_06614 [Aureobasidium subglaciale]KAI5233199.1 hypothetical protein E4T41_01532 [Aureobasidium subglaciale]KAI5260054.1 hypothetical protein E4T46_06414 [Aureobasidium subglaciale]
MAGHRKSCGQVSIVRGSGPACAGGQLDLAHLPLRNPDGASEIRKISARDSSTNCHIISIIPGPSRLLTRLSSLRKHEVKETEFEQGPSMEVRILAVQRVPTVHKLLYADSMYVCAPRPRLQRLRVAQTLNLVGPVEHKVSRSNTCAQRH